jgi:hypothetical protein
VKWYPRFGPCDQDRTEGIKSRRGERLQAALLLSAVVKSPELRQVRARVAPGSPELGRQGENAREGDVVRNEARASVGHWRGFKKGAGRMGGRRGRELGRGAKGPPRGSKAGAGRADLTGQAHSAEREKGTRGATTRQLANQARETEREEGSAGLETDANRSAPLGSEREEGSAGQTAADRRGLPVRASGRATWLGRAGLVCCFSFFFFSGFSNSFSIFFSL